ncbi:MAG: 3-hydroxyacyl-ACP dehydratase FabZ [Acidobacteria bacterium]|nr:3-hydroxyacyl-ACP dehydratase FabZ [Acidobacteriota bacterium]
MELQKYLDHFKHRYPFLFIDRLIEVVPGQSCRALKNVSMNEKVFVGHFPDRPLMPGVLFIEMMAQASIMIFASEHNYLDAQHGVLAHVDKVKFLKTASPGDQLIIDVSLDGKFGKLAKFKGTVSCDGAVMAKGSFTVSLPRNPAGRS